MSDREGGGFLSAFVLGALFGAGLAIVLAPQSGEKTRKQLDKKTRKLRKNAGKKLDHAMETGEEWLGDASELTGPLAEAVEAGVSAIQETVSDELERIEKLLGRKKKKRLGLFG